MNKKKFESYVLSMSEEMGEITIEQFAHIEAAMKSIAYVNRKGVIRCMDCGHTWEADSCSIDGTIECPVCHRKLKIEWTGKTHMNNMEFVSISQAWGDHWQVVRYFAAYHYSFRNEPPVKEVYEVMQVWISDKGDVVHIARDLAMYPNRQRNPFILSRGMKVKHPEKSNSYYSFDIRLIRCDSLKIFSVAKFLKYYGIKKDTYRRNAGFYLDVLFQVVQEPLAEVLYKNKQYDLLQTLWKRDFYKHDENYAERIASLKIALRHNYFEKVKFVKQHRLDGSLDDRPLYSDWIDNINNILKLGLDNRSPHYVCPEDFRDMHYTLSRRAMNLMQVERTNRKTARILSDEEKKEAYIRERKAFFDMELKSDGFTIKVLPSVEAFEKEGTEMKHCVFANEYYDVENKPYCLILSARSGEDWNNPDETIETIEVNLETYTVIQSRGHCNQNTAYHNKIMALVLNHMDEIKEINESRFKNKHSEAA